MKYASLLITVVLFLSSCSKSSSPGSNNNGNSTSSYVSTATSYGVSTSIAVSLTYDSQHRIAGFTQSSYDTSSGSPYYSTYAYAFTLPSGSGGPTAYTVTYSSSNTVETQGTGTLSYDDQGRILKDTSLDGSGDVVYYAYPDAGTIVYNASYGNGSALLSDTILLSNGNIGSETENDVYPSSPSSNETDTYQFAYSTTIANPLYNATTENSMGVWFYSNIDAQAFDFISTQMYNSVVEDGITYACSLSTDSQGRLVQMATGSGQDAARIVYSY